MSKENMSEAYIPTIDKDSIAWTKSVFDYVLPRGVGLEGRCAPYHDYADERRDAGTWWVGRVLMSQASHTVTMADEFGQNPQPCINFGSQDYLALSQHPQVKEAAKRAVDEWGIHSAGSPALIGRTDALLRLEWNLRSLLSKEACTIYPTGWAAGFGVITGLVRQNDSVIMDTFSHNCLHEGAKHATKNILKFTHNDLNHLEYLLQEERGKRPRNGLFIIMESLYSMDSDSPNLSEAIKLVRKYNGILILDVAHDFGAMGESGLGLLETVSLVDGPDIIMGSFSKTFASNGGFIASSQKVKDYLALHSSPLTFSNAFSPIQTCIVSQCFDIIFSDEGAALRRQLSTNITLMRTLMAEGGMEVGGTPSPIVPVFVGDERIARLTYKHLASNLLLANLVEFPGVPKGKARFRFQMMSSHTASNIRDAAGIMVECREKAMAEWQNEEG